MENVRWIFGLCNKATLHDRTVFKHSGEFKNAKFPAAPSHARQQIEDVVLARQLEADHDRNHEGEGG